MAGFRNGFIKLDSSRGVFYPGQLVAGSVVFEIEQPLTLCALHINFLGEATVDWTETESEEYNGEKRYKDIEYVGREEYFNFTQLLAGGNAPIQLPPGTHTYQFSYLIPPGIPSSFSGERGSVSYCVKAMLDLTGQLPFKQEYSKYFEVVAPFDLNLGSPRLKEPIEMEFEEVYNCGCFCSSDPVTVKVRVPASGYCPGQTIPVSLDIHNQSSVEISKVILQILKRERYRTQRPVSEYIPPEQVLESTARGAVLSGCRRSVTLPLQVPRVVAANLDTCSIIDVGYFFRIIIKLSGCNDDLEDEAEICLGLVPLNETVEGQYVHPLVHSLPLGPIPDAAPPALVQEQLNSQTNQSQAMMPTGYPYPGSNTSSSYFVQVQKQYISSDPTKNYQIGFTMTGTQPDINNFPGQNWTGNYRNSRELKIHLPQPGVNIHTPSAPPPSS